MPARLTDSTLASIERMKEEFARSLGPDAKFPDDHSGEKSPYFPELAPEILEAIAAGNGREHLAKTIDHTILKPEARPGQIETLCREAAENGFAAICVNGGYISLAKTVLSDAAVDLAAVVGFPLGQMATKAKVFETKLAVEDGATEIDMVLNVGWLKDKKYKEVFEDIRLVVEAAGVPVKVILETCLLTEEEKIATCLLSAFAKAAFVKTSTGFSSGGATEADVALMRAVVGSSLGVKASGGVKDFAGAVAMLEAGANRIGTSSGLAIVG